MCSTARDATVIEVFCVHGANTLSPHSRVLELTERSGYGQINQLGHVINSGPRTKLGYETSVKMKTSTINPKP